MRVGYHLTGLQNPSQEKEFAKFLRDKLILEEGYAENMAKVAANGDAFNVFTRENLSTYFSGSGGYDFVIAYSAIDITAAQKLIASAVDFRLEIQFQGAVKVLAPTQYFITTASLAETLSEEIRQGLLKVYSY